MVTPPVPSPRYSQERVSSIHPEDLMQIVSHMDSRDKHRVRAAGALEGVLTTDACGSGLQRLLQRWWMAMQGDVCWWGGGQYSQRPPS